MLLVQMRQSEAWQRYFEANRDRPSPPIGPVDAIDDRLRAALVRSLGRFFLGESSEGRIAREAASADDPALDAAMRESIALYVREEGRHAREIAGALRAFGASPPRRHWTEALFRRGRRLLGLRTKMMVIAAAEVVGLVFYGLLAERVPPLAAMARAIANDEERHLEFQVDYFTRVLHHGGRIAGGALAATGFVAITSCAVATFLVDHAPLLDAFGVPRSEIVVRCTRIARASFGACAIDLALDPRDDAVALEVAAAPVSPSALPVNLSAAPRPAARSSRLQELQDDHPTLAVIDGRKRLPRARTLDRKLEGRLLLVPALFFFPLANLLDDERREHGDSSG